MTSIAETSHEKGQVASLALGTCYASGEQPKRGDVTAYNEKWEQPIPSSLERNQTWIVTSVVDDMVRCKCEGAPLWRQAHYTKDLKLVRRHNNPDHTRGS